MKRIAYIFGIVALVAALVGTLIPPKAIAVFVIRDLLPEGIARKLAQGLAKFHEFEASDIDYRYNRYVSAFRHVQQDLYTYEVVDSTSLPLTEIGVKFLGENPENGFGTLMGYSVDLAGDVTGGAGAELVAGGYEHSDSVEERGIVYVVVGTGEFETSLVKVYGEDTHRG